MASPKYPLSVFDVATALKNCYRDFNHYYLTGMANVPPLKKLAMPVSPYPNFPPRAGEMANESLRELHV